MNDSGMVSYILNSTGISIASIQETTLCRHQSTYISSDYTFFCTDCTCKLPLRQHSSYTCWEHPNIVEYADIIVLYLLANPSFTIRRQPLRQRVSSPSCFSKINKNFFLSYTSANIQRPRNESVFSIPVEYRFEDMQTTMSSTGWREKAKFRRDPIFSIFFLLFSLKIRHRRRQLQTPSVYLLSSGQLNELLCIISLSTCEAHPPETTFKSWRVKRKPQCLSTSFSFVGVEPSKQCTNAQNFYSSFPYR